MQIYERTMVNNDSAKCKHYVDRQVYLFAPLIVYDILNVLA